MLRYGHCAGAEISPALIQGLIPLLGAYQVYTALAAYSVGCLGMSDTAINTARRSRGPRRAR